MSGLGTDEGGGEGVVWIDPQSFFSPLSSKYENDAHLTI